MVCKVNFTPHKHFPFSSMLTYSNGVWEGFRPRNAALMMQHREVVAWIFSGLMSPYAPDIIVWG